MPGDHSPLAHSRSFLKKKRKRKVKEKKKTKKTRKLQT
jgi:hypothetical protein